MKTMDLFIRLILLGLLFGNGGTLLCGQSAPNAPERRGEFVIHGTLGEPQAPETYLLSMDLTGYLNVREEGVTERWDALLKAVAGSPRIVEIALGNEAQIQQVSGEGLQGWAVRPQSDGKKGAVLVLAFDKPLGQQATRVNITRRNKSEVKGGYSLLRLRPRQQDFMQGKVNITTQPGFQTTVNTRQAELQSLGIGGSTQIVTLRGMEYELDVQVAEGAARAYTLEAARLVAVLNEEATFEWDARIVVTDPSGAQIWLLGNEHALLSPIDVPDTAKILRLQDGFWLKVDKPGTYPIKAKFAAVVSSSAKQSSATLNVFGGLIRQLQVQLPSANYQFAVDDLLVAVKEEGKATVSLSSQKPVNLKWQPVVQEAVDRVFYTVEGIREMTVSGRMVEQVQRLEYRVTQGKLNEVELMLMGGGDIISVEAPGMSSWDVKRVPQETDSTSVTPSIVRILSIRMNQALSNDFTVSVTTRQNLGIYPVVFSPLTIRPIGALRYVGHVGVRVDSQTKVSVADSEGMTQLSANLFPVKTRGREVVLAFRHGGPEFSLKLRAEMIVPQIMVSQLLFYEVTQAGRKIEAEMDIEVREAPVSRLHVNVPKGFIVSSVQFGGRDLNQFSFAPKEGGDHQILTLFLPAGLSGRGLLRLQLEENRRFADDSWILQPVWIEGAEIRRGFIGVGSVDGIRVQPGQVSGLGEISPAYLPKTKESIYLAWRVERSNWNSEIKLKQMERVVRVDAFHLFTVADESIMGSSILNVMVSGAPVQSLRFELTAEYRNVDFSGEGIRTWKLDGSIAEIMFQSPRSGAFTLLSTYEMTNLKAGEKASFRGLKPAFEASDLGVVALVSPLPYRVTDKEGNMESLEPSRIPQDFQLLYNSPVVEAFQYHKQESELKLGLTSLQESDRMQQSVDSMRASSIVGESGEVVTTLHYVVQSNRSAYFSLMVPDGYRLWSAKVSGNEVQPVKDGARVLIPLPVETGDGGRYPIMLSIAHPPAERTGIHLRLPVLDTALLYANWDIQAEGGLYPEFMRGTLLPENWHGEDEKDYKSLLFSFVLGGLALWGVMLVIRGKSIWIRLMGVFGAVLLGGMAVLLAINYLDELTIPAGSTKLSQSLQFRTEVVPAEQSIEATIRLLEHNAYASHENGLYWWLGVAAGVAALWFGAIRRQSGVSGILTVLAIGLWGYALGGEVSALIAGVTMAAIVLLLIVQIWIRARAETVVLAVVVLFMCGPTTSEIFADKMGLRLPLSESNSGIADKVHHQVVIEENEARVHTTIEWNAESGSRLLLLREPARLRDIQMDKEKLTWLRNQDGSVVLWARDKGTYSIVMDNLIPIQNEENGLFRLSLPFVAGLHATASIEVKRDGRYVLSSEQTARIGTYEAVMGDAPGESPEENKSTWLLLFPSNQIQVVGSPAPRDIKNEKPVYYSNAEHVVQPVAGAVLMRHTFRVHFAQGQLDEFIIRLPQGHIVSAVENWNPQHWRFDAEKGLLRMRSATPVHSNTVIHFITEAPQKNLPFDASVTFPELEGAQNKIGKVTLATAEDLSVTGIHYENGYVLSEASNLPSIEGKEHGEIRSRVVLSYSFNSMTLRFRAVAVDPEVRVESNQSLVLTEDRLALAYQGRVFIDQVGVFSLQMQIPTNFDLESITSNQMSYWNYLTEDKRLIQINFNERIRGSHTITAALSNNAYRHQERLELPQVEILGTERETGWYHVQPELGLKVDIGETANSLVVNPEEQGIQRPGGLLLRILEKKWTASLALTRMDPWIQSESLQSYHYEEGRVEVKALIALQIENSGVRQLRLSLPDNPVTLQVRHDRVSNVRREESGDWLISLDRRVIGRLELELSYDLHDHSPGDKITTGLLRVVDASRERRFVTIHTHPAIQMIPQRQSDEMIPILWANIPERLRAFGQEPASNLIYRVSGTESNMVFALRRLTASGDLLSARVVETRILSRLSDSGYGITETRLLLHPGDERYLRLRIGKGQSLWTATVNGETAWVWREGEDWLIPLEKNTVQNAPTEVRLFVEHSLDLAKKNRVLLQVPDFSLPLQNITWVVHAPARWQIDREQVKGNLRLAEVEQVASLYNSDKWNQQDQSSQTAKGLYELGRRLYQEGNVDAASQAFRSSYNMSQNYEALNRDALVEWNRVRTQQAFQGITQRRGNIQQELPIAVMQQQTSNMAIPVQDGQDAQALMRLAQKLIEQQNAALVIPAPFTMQLPDRGGQHTIAFTRPVLVDPWASLSIELPVVRALPDSDYSRPAAALIIALIAAGLLWMWTRRR